MHPSCALIVWLAAVVGAQFVGYAGLALLAVAALALAPRSAYRWLGYVRRARWLLLTLWLILAYNAPGEAWLDKPWAPTYEGMAEAGLQAVRLLVMLLWLAWLFTVQGRDGMVSGLWGLLRPWGRFGGKAERLVVRLSLVLDNLQAPQEKGAWRRMLLAGAHHAEGPSSLGFLVVPWAPRDSLAVLGCIAGLVGVWMW
ncbi:hypothetical protein [uncultured Dechloromonas sp.]|uniref:hypothetical protein n=1 Tax=uncultured Dechloromonas sp. TaxID=171719 RepID=UPI0025CDB2C2|nr:hypothetical protein [uncultured Dechloromonas sp.]